MYNDPRIKKIMKLREECLHLRQEAVASECTLRFNKYYQLMAIVHRIEDSLDWTELIQGLSGTTQTRARATVRLMEQDQTGMSMFDCLNMVDAYMRRYLNGR